MSGVFFAGRGGALPGALGVDGGGAACGIVSSGPRSRNPTRPMAASGFPQLPIFRSAATAVARAA